MEEVKYDMHNKNSKKGKGYVEVDINFNGEENHIFPRVASSNLREGSQPIDWYQLVIV